MVPKVFCAITSIIIINLREMDFPKTKSPKTKRVCQMLGKVKLQVQTCF